MDCYGPHPPATILTTRLAKWRKRPPLSTINTSLFTVLSYGFAGRADVAEGLVSQGLADLTAEAHASGFKESMRVNSIPRDMMIGP
jgi:hypothetical protein